MVRDLDWPYTTLIGASSLGVVLGALIGPWVGRIVDRRGARLVLCVSVAAAAGSTAAAGLTAEPWHLFLSYGVISGATRAILMNVAPGAIIANWFRRRRAAAYGAAAMGPPAASIVLPTLVALATQAFSWRGAWLAVAIGTLVIGFPPMAILVRRHPEDIWMLARTFPFDGPLLAQAIASTFDRRGTAVPRDTPAALSEAFEREWERQWPMFLRRSGLPDAGTLAKALIFLREFLIPPSKALTAGSEFGYRWDPSDGWKPSGLPHR